MSKRLRTTLFVALATIIVAITGGSFYMLHFALDARKFDTHDLPTRLNRIVEKTPWIRPWVDSLKNTNSLRDTFIMMPTGEKHHAVYIKSRDNSGKTAVLIHGYTDNAMAMMHVASIYAGMDYNILMPDLHAHGLSEGRGIQMGWKDRLDVMRWMAVADTLFSRKGEHSSMVVHGISMGASTAMNISGEKLPPYVKCFIADCGFTSAWDEFAYELKSMFHLPAFPLLYTTNMLCKLKYGWSFKEASSLRQVAKCRLPMLFIHGDKDTFVPFNMVFELYKAKPAPKQLYISRGTIHAKSFWDHPQEYEEKVKSFTGRWIDK